MEKDLGVHVDSHLNYAQHICQAKNKGNMLLAVVRRTYEYLDEESLMLLYKGLVRPAVEYGVVVWAQGFNGTSKPRVCPASNNSAGARP